MKCEYCELEQALLTRDHIIPVSKGGTGHSYNIANVCRQCNLIKGNILPYDFLIELKRLIDQNQEYRIFTVDRLSRMHSNLSKILSEKNVPMKLTEVQGVLTHNIFFRPAKNAGRPLNLFPPRIIESIVTDSAVMKPVGLFQHDMVPNENEFYGYRNESDRSMIYLKLRNQKHLTFVGFFEKAI